MEMAERPNRKLLLGQHKHHCCFCEKSFGRRKELREHMWTHMANGEHIPNNSAADAMCAAHTNPTRHRTGRFCENCGKEIVSLKLRLKHGRCRSVEPAAGGEDDAPSPSPPSPSQSCYRNKRPRSAPAHLLTEEDLARYLVMLSHDRPDSSPSTSNEAGGGIRRREPPLQPPVSTLITATIPRGMFACKTCKKVFSSHQALGGHRASHKKVKGCFAGRGEIASPEANNAPVEDARITVSAENRASSIVPSAEDSSSEILPQSKVHECSICRRQFMSGQALGGHKRCHWLTSNSAAAAANAVPIAAAATAELMNAVEVGSGSDEVNGIQPHSPTTIWPMFSSSDSPPEPDMATRVNEVAEITPMVDGSSEICLRLGWDTVENDNEAESKGVTVLRLIDLIDMEEGQESSTWLQIGIGSMADQQSPADRT